MSSHEDQSTAASELNAAERISEITLEFSPDLIDEKINPPTRLNLEHLHAQVTALTQMMDNVIQDNSARAYPTASTRDRQFPSKSPLTDNPGTSRALPFAPLTTTGYSPDS